LQGATASAAVPATVRVADEKVKEEKHGVIKVIKPKATPAWLSAFYSPNAITADELAEYYNALRYVGFDRELMLAKIEQQVGDIKLAVQLVIACALRGPQAASVLKLSNGRTPVEMGIPGSGKMGTEDLSCQRVVSATADLAAFYLKLLDIPKRMPTLDCPGWLQFPSAGSIKLPQDLRNQHIEFSKRFSTVIGGVFREEIYSQMMQNSYLNPELHLFDQ
jgi:hypothetical protein